MEEATKRANAKTLYWNYFVSNKKYWGNGFTQLRLEKIKDRMFRDKYFWDDILIRHGGLNFTPKQLEELDQNIYHHCMGNMTGMIMQFFVEHRIIRP